MRGSAFVPEEGFIALATMGVSASVSRCEPIWILSLGRCSSPAAVGADSADTVCVSRPDEVLVSESIDGVVSVFEVMLFTKS